MKHKAVYLAALYIFNVGEPVAQLFGSTCGWLAGTCTANGRLQQPRKTSIKIGDSDMDITDLYEVPRTL
jgi:hypothetical protein